MTESVTEPYGTLISRGYYSEMRYHKGHIFHFAYDPHKDVWEVADFGTPAKVKAKFPALAEKIDEVCHTVNDPQNS